MLSAFFVVFIQFKMNEIHLLFRVNLNSLMPLHFLDGKVEEKWHISETFKHFYVKLNNVNTDLTSAIKKGRLERTTQNYPFDQST